MRHFAQVTACSKPITDRSVSKSSRQNKHRQHHGNRDGKTSWHWCRKMASLDHGRKIHFCCPVRHSLWKCFPPKLINICVVLVLEWVRLNFRIPVHLLASHWIRIATIVIFLVLQSTPTHVNGVDGYSEVAPGFWKTHSCKLIPNWSRNSMITYTNRLLNISTISISPIGRTTK